MNVIPRHKLRQITAVVTLRRTRDHLNDPIASEMIECERAEAPNVMSCSLLTPAEREYPA